MPTAARRDCLYGCGQGPVVALELGEAGIAAGVRVDVDNQEPGSPPVAIATFALGQRRHQDLMVVGSNVAFLTPLGTAGPSGCLPTL